MQTVDVQLFALTQEMLGPSALHELPAGLQRGLRLPRRWAQPELSQLPFAFCILHDLGWPTLALGSDPTSQQRQSSAAKGGTGSGSGARVTEVPGVRPVRLRSPLRPSARLRCLPYPPRARLRRPCPLARAYVKLAPPQTRPVECACAKIAPPPDAPSPTSPRPPRTNAPARRCPATGWTRARHGAARLHREPGGAGAPAAAVSARLPLRPRQLGADPARVQGGPDPRARDREIDKWMDGWR